MNNIFTATMKRILVISAMLIFSIVASAQTEDVPLAGGVRQNSGLSTIFHTWGFIGDSLSSGEHEYYDAGGGKHYVDLYEYSWGQRICAATGAKGDNYGQGGETAGGWLEHFWDKVANRNGNIDAKASPKQAYIIALGVNDRGRGVPKDKFAEQYSGIIDRILSIQPKAKIFVVTMPRDNQDREPYNEVIRSVAAKYPGSAYILDIHKYGPDYSDPAFRTLYFLGGHMNAAGYEFTAWMFMNYIDWIIRHNPTDFAQAAFIGTDYSWKKQ